MILIVFFVLLCGVKSEWLLRMILLFLPTLWSFTSLDHSYWLFLRGRKALMLGQFLVKCFKSLFAIASLSLDSFCYRTLSLRWSLYSWHYLLFKLHLILTFISNVSLTLYRCHWKRWQTKIFSFLPVINCAIHCFIFTCFDLYLLSFRGKIVLYNFCSLLLALLLGTQALRRLSKFAWCYRGLQLSFAGFKRVVDANWTDADRALWNIKWFSFGFLLRTLDHWWTYRVGLDADRFNFFVRRTFIKVLRHAALRRSFLS